MLLTLHVAPTNVHRIPCLYLHLVRVLAALIWVVWVLAVPMSVGHMPAMRVLRLARP